MPENPVSVYLDLPAELQSLLSANQRSIKDILRENNIEAEVSFGSLPAESPEAAESKDLAVIILVSAASVALVGAAITQALDAYWHRPIITEYAELQTIKDAGGNVLLDKKKKPLMRRVVRQRLLEPHKRDQKVHLEIHFDFKNGLVIKFCTDAKQLEPAEPAAADPAV